ncbi:RCC1 domain-containing protein, partial [Oligoflexus tunisiensis]|uniref:RCC1 domain-containing protein n=1 Tax=Oligoflexus tunisiensis TaxID=708132 RepID=UPI001C407805
TSLRNVFCWGSDSSGQLGDGATLADKNIPTALDMTSLATGERFTRLTAGASHGCGITSHGRSFCWGSDGSGQLGDGSTLADKGIPTAVDVSSLASGEVFSQITAGGTLTCGLTSHGRGFCWGAGSRGQIGDGGNTDRGVPTPIDDSIL